MANGSIGLTIPELQVPTSQSFDTRPAKVDAWVDGLPHANIGETTRAILNALYETNRLQFPWQDRLSLLEKLANTIQHIGTQLEQRFVTQTHPLPDQVRQIALLVKTLYQESALGYKIAMEQMLAGNDLSIDRHALVTLLHRALFYLGRVLLTGYQSYTTNPPGTWYDIHLLHQYARQQQLDQTVAPGPDTLPMAVMTIGGLYKQILLLSLASPTRLNPGEVTQACQALNNWSSSAQLTPYDIKTHHDALFVIPLKSDHEPEYLAYAHHECDDSNCLLLDTRQMIEQIAEEYARITHSPDDKGDDLPRTGLSADLLIRLGRAWGMVSKRNIDRTECDDIIEAVVGLKSLHQALLDEVTSHTEAESNRDSDSLWTLFNTDTQPEAVGQDIDTFPQNPATIRIHEWRIQNESSGGYRLAASEQWADIQVGSLLGLRHSGGGWQAGVVRWLNDQDASHLTLGVQLLAQRAYPAMIQPPERCHGGERAIVLPAIPQLGLGATLLTTDNPLSLHHPIRLYSHGQAMLIRLDNIYQQNSGFTQFLIHGMQRRNEQEDAHRGADKVPWFTELWEQL